MASRKVSFVAFKIRMVKLEDLHALQSVRLFKRPIEDGLIFLLWPGNAVFHDATLCRDFEAVVPLCLRLFRTEMDDRTRANAASVLGNLVKNTSQLCNTLQQANTVPALVDLIDKCLACENEHREYAAVEAALFTLGNFCSYPSLKQEILQNNIHVLLKKVGSFTHPRILQFGKRLCQKLQRPEPVLP